MKQNSSKVALSAAHLVKTFGLEAHPEGGYFKETYRCEEKVRQAALPARFSGDRSLATAIYFLLPQGSKSHLHRIAADEIWHFYLGGSLTIVEISPEGKVQRTILGSNILAGEQLQYVVKAGHWFGAYPQEDCEFSFVGCTVAPGFDFADFELGRRSQLLAQYPAARQEVLRLTPCEESL